MSDSSLSDLEEDIYDYDQDEIMVPSSDEDIDTGLDDAYPDDDSSLGGEDEFITLPLGGGNGKGKQASYNVDFHVISKQELVIEMAREIDHVSSALSLTTNDAAALLRHMKWNKERVIDRYMEDPDKLRRDAGVDRPEASTSVSPQSTSSTSQPRLKRMKGFVCEICYDTPQGSVETLALSCQHRYCRDCYTSYLEQKIKDEGEAKNLQCMAPECTIVMNQRTVSLLVGPRTMDRYRELLNRSYVDDDPSLRWCPAPNCEYAIRCPGITPKSLHHIVPIVTCACNHKFCFGCGLSKDHQPCICYIVKLWLKKCADDSETANWIQANTKECPKCQATIEKNGGCNHMTCKKCKYEFCWICMGEWSAHGTSWYNCNRFDEKKDTGKDAQSKSRASLERYLHYYNRWANHEQSIKLEKNTYVKIERKMNEMQEQSALSWIEVQFLKRAVDILSDCRATLMWTYCQAYYLEKNNHTYIFEANQQDLEMAVENLSELIEQPFEAEDIPALKAKVTDKSVYVQKRHHIMLEDSLSGLTEDRWIWTIPLR